MKKLFLLLAAVGTIFTACHNNQGGGGNTPEQPEAEDITPASNELRYISTDGVVVTPYAVDVFGAAIQSNNYVDGCGVITFDGDVTEVGVSAFESRSTLKRFALPETVTSIGESAFDSCTGLLEINIPNSVTSIDEYAFYFCQNLQAVTIPNGITELRNSVFKNCQSLKSIDVPENITAIGDDVFYLCIKMESATIGSNVSSIGDYAFRGCDHLKSVYCKATTPPTLGERVFDENDDNRKIYVPTASVEAYKSAWSDYADAIEGYDF